jgi:hypothetical protein
MTYADVEWRAGLQRSTLKSWRLEKFPSLRSAEAALGALGWGLAPYPLLETLPPRTREMAEDLGMSFFRDDHALAAAVAAALTKPAIRAKEGQPAPRLEYRTPYWREEAA